MSEVVTAERQLSDRRYRQLASVIEQSVGIQLPPSKRVMVEGRLRRRARTLGFSDVDEYCASLFDGGRLDAEYVHLVDLVTTNKTDFFREAEHFDFLRSHAVPALIAPRDRDRPARLKIWSAACSNGAEPYTIAMVLEEAARAAGGAFSYSILGTDVCTQVLEQARRAIYPIEMVAPVPPELRQRYVMLPRDSHRQEVRISPILRSRVRFHHLNLMDQRYPFDRDVDVVFCRNVLIYFDRTTQHAVLSRLCGHLRPGGYLIVGHSESSSGSNLVGMRQVMTTIWQRC